MVATHAFLPQRVPDLLFGGYEAGEEVTDIYSMHFSEIHRERRRDWLEQSFHFLCQCQACTNDWKTFDSLGKRKLTQGFNLFLKN